MVTWEYSSLKLTLVFVFQKIGRQVQGKLTRWKEYVFVERNKILSCFAPCLSLVFKIQKLVDFIFIDNASGQCKVPSRDLLWSVICKQFCVARYCYLLYFELLSMAISDHYHVMLLGFTNFTTCYIWLRMKNGFIYAMHIIRIYLYLLFRSSSRKWWAYVTARTDMTCQLYQFFRHGKEVCFLSLSLSNKE